MVTLKDFLKKGNNFMGGVALIHGEVGIGKTAFMVSNKRGGYVFLQFLSGQWVV